MTTTNGGRSHGLEIIDPIQVNTVIWLRSVPENELGPSERMVHDLAIATIGNPFAFEEIVVSDRAEMLGTLTTIAERCATGLRPILHFDCHGSEAEGLRLAPSAENVGWEDLADALRAINVATGNNLCCIFGVCFGLHLSLTLDLKKPSPYFLTIAPERKIEVGVLERYLPDFYAALFKTQHITNAFETHLRPHLTLYNCKALVVQSLAQFWATFAMGKGLKRWRERNVSLALAAHGISQPTAAQLGYTRQVVKRTLRPTQAIIAEYAKSFLIGRDLGFGVEEVMRLATGYKGHLERQQRRQERARKSRPVRER
ncbi:hypothetical protein HNO88_002594 [Novosphingobium chloroacetimidivorans]|uniref:Uncharacterized protein n=1 Tax=Novosphingobium chloroacetimidivorans TaxID=1428314 RepID=A0A7W7NXJ4_9SPHN|nr:hypothetical protein [Novosphingobium chloroacetimidivorans]MBB4859265.1 hypothetical protein [Novosphingobium chloroacetimidivorans]